MTSCPSPARTSIFVVTALTLAAQGASAQSTSAEAERLFKDGKALMAEGRIAEACTAFEGSYRKDPAVSTLLNLADCREKNHQLASAWGYFLDADRATRSDPAKAALNQTARDRAAKLEPRLSYLVVNVADEARVDGLEVSRNGRAVDPAEWNRKIPVDGGTYTIEGKAPAHEPWSAKVTVGDEHDTQSVDVPRFKELPTPPPGDDGGDGADPVDRGAPSGLTGKRKAALGLVGVGVVAGVGALVLELSARSTYDDSKIEPDDAKQKDLYDTANQRRLYAQIAGGVGVVAVGAAAALWITGKPTSGERVSVRPILGRDKVGFALAGHF